MYIYIYINIYIYICIYLYIYKITNANFKCVRSNIYEYKKTQNLLKLIIYIYNIYMYM